MCLAKKIENISYSTTAAAHVYEGEHSIAILQKQAVIVELSKA